MNGWLVFFGALLFWVLLSFLTALAVGRMFRLAQAPPRARACIAQSPRVVQAGAEDFMRDFDDELSKVVWAWSLSPRPDLLDLTREERP